MWPRWTFIKIKYFLSLKSFILTNNQVLSKEASKPDELSYISKIKDWLIYIKIYATLIHSWWTMLEFREVVKLGNILIFIDIKNNPQQVSDKFHINYNVGTIYCIAWKGWLNISFIELPFRPLLIYHQPKKQLEVFVSSESQVWITVYTIKSR